jgi:hypothetical protein
MGKTFYLHKDLFDYTRRLDWMENILEIILTYQRFKPSKSTLIHMEKTNSH